jgi:hypothetical protein
MSATALLAAPKLAGVGQGVKAGGGVALAPLPVGGRRRSAKKLRVVKKKTVRRMLKKMGLKMRGGNYHMGGGDGGEGGEGGEGAAGDGAEGGRRRRRRTGKKSSRRGLFGKLF